MTKLKTRLPIKALSVLMAILMIFSTMSIMFTVSAIDREQGGGEGTWAVTDGTVTGVSGDTGTVNQTYSNQTIHYSVYLPKDYESYANNESGKKLAVMLVMSGGGEVFNSQQADEDASYAMARSTGLNYLADEKGIILVYFRQSSATINSGFYWNFFKDKDQGKSSNNYVMPKIINQLTTIKNNYASYIDSDRTYVTGISAGGAMAACFAAVYADQFAGAAIVAGLPYKMLTSSNYATVISGNTFMGTAVYAYQVAMDGTWTNYPTYTTLANSLTTAWRSAGKTDGIRTIVLQGGKDKVVSPKNGRLISMATAQAMGVFDGNTLNFNNNSFVNEATGDINGKGYTIHYYGTDSDMVAQGYSTLRASDVVYYQADDAAHQWVNRNADGFYSTRPSYVGQNTNVDYNELMWEFFEGDATPENVVEPVTTETIAPSYGALFGVKQDRGPDNNTNDSTIRDAEYKITGLDLVSAQGLRVTTDKLYPAYMSTTSVSSENTALWNFTFDLKSLYEAKAAEHPDKDVSIKTIRVKQNVWNIDYGSLKVNLSYKVVDKLALETTADAVKLANAEHIASVVLAPDNENDLLSGVISDDDALEALKSGYLNILTYELAYSANYNVAAPVVEVEFEIKDKPEVDEDDENDVEVEGDSTTTRTSNKLFPIFAYNSAAGYNAVEASGYETKTYNGSTDSFIAGTAGHLQATTKKYSVGVYNASDANDTIYYSFNLADYTKSNGYTIKSVTIKYTLEGNPYYSKEDVGVNMYLAGNAYWNNSASAPADSDMVTVENFTLAKGEKIEGEITISADNQSKLINYINNLGGLTVAFENTANNEHYYFLSTMPTITVNYEQVKDGTPGIITGIGVRTDKSYNDLTETTTSVENQTLTGITVSSEKNYYSSSYNTSGAFSETSGTNRAILSNFNVYKAVVDAIEAKYEGKKVSNIQFTVNSATFTISGRNTRNYSTYYAYGDYNATPQDEYITNGNQLNATSNSYKVRATLGSNGSTVSAETSISFSSGADFTEGTPYLWTKVAGNNSSYTEVYVPTITNLSVTYSATVTESLEPDNSGDDTPGEGGEGGGDIPGGTVQPENIEVDLTINSLTPIRSYYSTTSNATGTSGFYDSTQNPRTIVATYDIYSVVNSAVSADLEEKYSNYDISNLEITVNSATMTIYGRRYSNYASGSAYGYFHPTAQSGNISNGSQLTSSNGTHVVEFAPSSTTMASEEGTMDLSKMNFTESTPNLWIRSHGTTGTQTTRYVIIDDPEISDLKITYTATVTPKGGAGGSGNGGSITLSTPVSVEAVLKRNASLAYKSSTADSDWETFTDWTDTYSANIYTYDLYSAFQSVYNNAESLIENATGREVAVINSISPILKFSSTGDVTTTQYGVNYYYAPAAQASQLTVYNSALTKLAYYVSPGSSSGQATNISITPSASNPYLWIWVYADMSYGNWPGTFAVQITGFTYDVTFRDELQPDPITSVDHNVSGDNKLTFTILADVSTTQVKVVNSADGSLIGDSNQYTTTAEGNVFTITVNAPANDTKYHVFGGSQGTYDEEKYVECSVKGTDSSDITMDAIGNLISNVTNGTTVEIANGTSYEDVRVVTTSTSQVATTKPTVKSGYLVGTNEKYYTKSDSNYYTSDRRNTGSPQADTSIKTTSTTFPVSYLGYGYINYDLSSAFALETTATGNYEVVSDKDGVKVEERTRTETVITDIKISAVRAQEGYTGGWAARYTVSGNAFVTGGSAVPNGADKPTNFQNLGDGSVSTNMGNIGSAASLNAEQMAKARQGKNVTVWINNTGCDWNSYYYPSAWLLVEMPTVTVTTKTITYTDKRITETKSTANDPIVTKSDVTEGDTIRSSTVSASSGYLLGRGYEDGSTYRYQTVNSTSNYGATANTTLQTNRNAFAVTYLGKGYVLYNIGNATGGTDRQLTNTETKKMLVGGQFVDARVETYTVSTASISNIKVSGTIQAGFQANSSTAGNNANSYNITNVIYAAGTDTWTGTGYPDDDAAWQALNIVYGIKKTNKSYTGYLSEDTIADVLENGYLTVRVDNAFNDWQNGGTLSEAYYAAWTLVTMPTVTLEYTTMEYTETVVTPLVDEVTTFKPTYEVYAQYNFISADGEVLSKTKPVTTLEGYGASVDVTPYIVDPDAVDAEGNIANLGTVYTLFSNGTLTDKTVEISMDGSRKDKYVLKDAYIEDVNTDVASIKVNTDGTYTINTLIDEGTKTNNEYKIRIIFDYYMEESSTTNTENSVKVNLHSVFKYGNDTIGEKLETGFAYLHNSSYIMSLDDVNIPYGDLTLNNGENVSAIFGSNRIYKFDNTQTRIEFAGATVTNTDGDTDVNTSDYQAKAYLDIANGTPQAGDVLVVTYNGNNSVAGQEIDVYLYYTAEEEYTIDVNYEFRIEGSFGEAIESTVVSKPDQIFYKGSMVLPYDLLIPSEGEDYSKITINGTVYDVSDFDYEITSNGVTLDDGVITSVDGANPSVTYKYTYKDTVVTKTDATVKHFYNIVYGGEVVDIVELPSTTAVLGNPAGSSVSVVLDSTDVISTTYGTFKAAQFAPVRIQGTNGLVFGDYSNGEFPTITVPQNTPNAEVNVIYELEVHKLTVTETFTQNGETVREAETKVVYVPKNSVYTFTSTLDPNMVPNNDGVKLSQYIVSTDDVTLTNDTVGSVSFSVVGFTGDMEVEINYEYSTYATAPLYAVHKFYKNNEYVGSIRVEVGTLTTDPNGNSSFTVNKLSGTFTTDMGVEVTVSGDEYYIYNTITTESEIVTLDTANLTVTYNGPEKGNQSDVDVVLDYYITDKATVTVTHKFNINGETVKTDVVDTITLVKGESQSIDRITGTVTYKGTEFNLADFTAIVVGSNGINTNGGLNNIVLDKYNVTEGTIEITYTLVVYEIKVNEEFIVDGNKTTETTTYYYMKGASDVIRSEYSTFNGVAIDNFLMNITDGYTIVILDGVATFDVIADGNKEITITYTLGTGASVTVTNKYYIIDNGNKIDITGADNLIIDVAPTTSLALVYNESQSIGRAQGEVHYNGSIFNLDKFNVEVKAPDYIAVNGLDVTLNAYNEPTATVTVEYTLNVYTITLNSYLVNGGEFVAKITDTKSFMIGDTIDTTTGIIKTVNGVEITFNFDKATGNNVTLDGNTITNVINGADLSIDKVYTANTTASVTVKHNFYIAGNLVDTIEKTVVVNPVYHNGKFVALSGIVALNNDGKIIFVNASDFTVTLTTDAENGTFENRVYTLNTAELDGSNYTIEFNYNVSAMSTAVDGTVGVKQTASANGTDGQYNVATTVKSNKNGNAVDIVFVVDVSAGMSGVTDDYLADAKAEIKKYIEASYAANANVRVAIITYAETATMVTNGYVTTEADALAAVDNITWAMDEKNEYIVATSNQQAGLYAARNLIASDTSSGYTDLVVIGTTPNAAYTAYGNSYDYSTVVSTNNTADAVNYELDRISASKENIIDLNTEADFSAKMTRISDERNYINVDGQISITINSKFDLVADSVTVNKNSVNYTYENGVLTVDLGTLKGEMTVEYTIELKDKKDGDYFVSDEIKVDYINSVKGSKEVAYGVSARVAYTDKTTAGGTITIITYLADEKLNPIGMDGLTIKNFYEDAIIGEPIVYKVYGVTNLTSGLTYTVKAPNISGYTAYTEGQELVKTVTISADNANAVVYFGYYASGALVDDSVVYDNSSAMIFDVLANDTRFNGVKFDTIYGIGSTPEQAESGNKTEVSVKEGKLEIYSGGKVKFTPNGITVTAELFYAVNDNGTICVGKIYVVPATIVKGDMSSTVQIHFGDRWEEVTTNGSATSGNADASTPDYDVMTSEGENLAVGKSYTTNVVYGTPVTTTNFKENGQLTNGNKSVINVDGNIYVKTSSSEQRDATDNEKKQYLRWTKNSSLNKTEVEVIVNLGSIMEFATFKVYSAASISDFTNELDDVKIYISENGNDYTEVNGDYKSQYLGNGEYVSSAFSKLYEHVVTSPKMLEAQYVKFVLVNSGTGITIDEVEITNELNSNSEPTNNNLLSGLTYESTTGSKNIYAPNGGIYDANLTDGIAGKMSSDANTWFGLRSSSVDPENANTINDSADFIYNLGAVYDLSSARIHLMNDNDNGVYAPKSLKLWVSMDGVNYGKYVTFTTDSTDDSCYWATLENIEGLVGKYVKITAELDGDWAMLNEIEVYGNLVADEEGIKSENYPSADDIYGGYEGYYSDQFGFDGGDAYLTDRYQDSLSAGYTNLDADYTATFEFTGTGFDIISVTGEYTGFVKITTTNKATGEVIKTASPTVQLFARIPNTYQSTIFSCTDLTHGTYVVTITALSTNLGAIFGQKGAQVYLDAVRVYNPFEGNTNEHYNDIHNGATTTTIKSLFVDGKLALNTNGGKLFTQSGSLNVAEFANKSTAYAIDLNKDQSLLFELSDASAYTSFQVEMAAIGSNATVEVYVNSDHVDTVELDTAVFAYYDFSQYIRENSTVKFTVVGGTVTFTKARYNNATIITPENGEKYAVSEGAPIDGFAPQAGELTDDYRVNTSILITGAGVSRVATMYVYTTGDVETVIAYVKYNETQGYRITPTAITKKAGNSEGQNIFIVTYAIPDSVTAETVDIDLYAFNSGTGKYSSNYKTVTFTPKAANVA